MAKIMEAKWKLRLHRTLSGLRFSKIGSPFGSLNQKDRSILRSVLRAPVF